MTEIKSLALATTNNDLANNQISFLFEQTADLVISLSSELLILNLNPAAIKFFGNKAKDCIGKKYCDVFDTDTVLCKILENKRQFFAELKHLYPKPMSQASLISDTHIAWLINAVGGESGEIEGLVLIGHTSKPIEMVEQKARDDKFRLETMIAHLPGNVYWMDKNCIHIGCNTNVLNMLGITREQYIGKTYEELAEIAGWKKGEAESFKKDDLEVLRTGIPKFDVEEPPLRHADGRIFHYLTTRVPMKNEAGDIVGVAGISVDITRLKKTEAALREAKEEAEIANRAKTDFLATVSHELRTPLNGILGIVQLLSKQNLSPKVGEYAEDIYEAGKHLLSLVNDMLDFSKLEAGKMEIISVPTNFKELIAETTDLLSHQIKAKGLDFAINYQDEAPYHVLTDPRAIRQIVLNLVGNAIKFTEKGQILVRVSCIRETPNEVELQLSVKDSGIGIPKDKLDLIFERFKQLDSSLSRRYGGTGLGLAITKQLVEKLHGSIEVNSQIGNGSIFSVNFCFSKADVSAISPWDAYKTKVNVLIVDDLAIDTEIYQYLNVFDGQVISGNLAFEKYIEAQKKSAPYQIVIINENLLSNDSRLLANKITNAAKNNKPMLILLTQAGAKNTLKVGKSELFFDQLVKPAQPAELATSLVAEWEKWMMLNQVKTSSDNIKTKQPLLKVLVVEDNVLNQKVVRLLLKDLGCSVEVADRGKKVFELLHNNYDLIFMDIGLPDMTGIEVAKKVRQLGYDNVPIIALTAHVFETDKQSCLRAGMNDIVTKPIMNEQLIEILNRWTKNKRSFSSN